MDQTSVLYKNTIQYLHEIAEKTPNTLNVLKSYYASKFQISQLHTKIFLEKNKNKSDERCSRCCLKLREGETSYVLKPEPKKSKFARKVLRKVKTSKRLTKFQAKYLKKNEFKDGNRLVITCNFCKKEVVQVCTKPVRGPENNNNNNNVTSSNKKKRKRKKDKFCGLQTEAVVTVQKQVSGIENEASVKNNILNNPISKKKQKLKKKKSVNKLCNLLTQKSGVKSKKSNLTQFLEALNE